MSDASSTQQIDPGKWRCIVALADNSTPMIFPRSRLSVSPAGVLIIEGNGGLRLFAPGEWLGATMEPQDG